MPASMMLGKQYREQSLSLEQIPAYYWPEDRAAYPQNVLLECTASENTAILYGFKAPSGLLAL